MKEKICFTLKIYFLKQSDQTKRLIKVINKPSENLVRGRGRGAFLLTPWLTGIKHLNQITLCDINRVILLVIIVIVDT